VAAADDPQTGREGEQHARRLGRTGAGRDP
jgi:hypothetical protein